MQPFELKTPASLEDAIKELPSERSYAAPQPIAGGQDILTVMKDDIAAPSTLVEIGHLLSTEIVEEAGGLTMGAGVTIQQIADHAGIRSGFTALAEAAESVASPQIRSQATLGGNLNQKPRCPYYRHSAVSCFKKGGNVCLAEFGFNKYSAILGGGPSYFSHPSDMATALLALGASVVIQGAGGTRTVPIAEFYVGPEDALDRETVLEAHEIVTSITVPRPASGAKTTYYKFKERASYDFALGAVAITLRVEGGTIAEAKVALGGVAPQPWHSPETEAALVGKPMNAETWKVAGEAAVADAVPLDMNGYKLHLVKGILHRALESLA